MTKTSVDNLISFVTLLAQPFLYPYLSKKERCHWSLLARIVKYVINKNLSEIDAKEMDICCTLLNALHSDLFGPQFTPLSIHVVLHLRSMFQKHGPAVNWWCFPFERQNEHIGKKYLLHCNYNIGHTPSNCKPGQIELTILSRYSLSQLINSAFEDVIQDESFEKKKKILIELQEYSFLPIELHVDTKVTKISSLDCPTFKLQVTQPTNDKYENPCGVVLKYNETISYGIVTQIFEVDANSIISHFLEVIRFYGVHLDQSFDVHLCQKFGVKQVVKLEDVMERCMFIPWNLYYMVTSKAIMNKSFDGIDAAITDCLLNK